MSNYTSQDGRWHRRSPVYRVEVVVIACTRDSSCDISCLHHLANIHGQGDGGYSAHAPLGLQWRRQHGHQGRVGTAARRWLDGVRRQRGTACLRWQRRQAGGPCRQRWRQLEGGRVRNPNRSLHPVCTGHTRMGRHMPEPNYNRTKVAGRIDHLDQIRPAHRPEKFTCHTDRIAPSNSRSPLYPLQLTKGPDYHPAI
jgi:hypothetical protein